MCLLNLLLQERQSDTSTWNNFGYGNGLARERSKEHSVKLQNSDREERLHRSNELVR